ncbi:MAG TPA: pyridoxal-phosphate dependent enzyme, partial [Herpetosiphonaceae bacterium]
YDVQPAPALTIADSINVELPQDGRRALRAVYQTNGQILAVDEQMILTAARLVAQHTGLFVEPASAVAFAGLISLVEHRQISSGDRIVVVSTGTGLKDVQAVLRADPQPVPIQPTLEAVRDTLQRR